MPPWHVAGLLPCVGIGDPPEKDRPPGVRDIDSDGERRDTAVDDEVGAHSDPTADVGDETTSDAPDTARADDSDHGGDTAADDSETDDSETPEDASRPDAEPPVTRQMPVVDAPLVDPDAPSDAETASTPDDDPEAETPSSSGTDWAAISAALAATKPDSTPEAEEPEAEAPKPDAAGNGTAAAAAAAIAAVGEEPAVTRQMPVIDAPPPTDEPAAAPGRVFDVPTVAAATTATPSTDADADADTDTATEADADAEGPDGPRHFRSGKFPAVTADEAPPDGRQLPKLALIAAPVALLVLLIAAWAIDTATHSGEVVRNVDLAGTSISGTSEDDLPGAVSELAVSTAAREVTLTSDGRTYQTTVSDLGLTIDQEATVDAAMDTGRGGFLLVQPFKWFGSFFGGNDAPLELTADDAKTVETLQRLQGADRTEPVEPTIELTANGFAMKAGQPGVGIDADEVTSELRRAVLAAPDGAIEIDAASQDEEPTFTDQQAQDLADRANGMTADGLTLTAEEYSAPVPAATLRGWLSPTVTDGQLDLAFNTDAATPALPGLLGGLTAEPKNATVTLNPSGQPVVTPGANGVECCGEGSADKVWQALRDSQPEVALEAKVVEPEHTTAEVEAWGIKQPIGGNRGFQNGAEIPSGLAAGFTTYHGAGEPRNKNIERIADEVRGAVIPPGGEFSINDRVGQRSYADGYVDAGAIREGRHVSEVGGGISQFATTTFNAAYFAGLDILESQSHSEWFTRYPPGREATMGFPHPDVRIRNNTPYGVLIWTSYTPTSITVTFYSTPHAQAEQTNKAESMNGACRVVVTTRTRTYPDGTTEQDQFKSTYRPEGKRCDGSVIPPAEPPPPPPPPPGG